MAQEECEDADAAEECLMFKRFMSASGLAEFVNKCQIAKSDIQTICRESDDCYVLFYWV